MHWYIIHCELPWVFIFEQLGNEIKLRHYSPKTLKDYRQLSQQDVIDFLTFLAVERQVSAASQNSIS